MNERRIKHDGGIRRNGNQRKGIKTALEFCKRQFAGSKGNKRRGKQK